jgi:hypothetical protein
MTCTGAGPYYSNNGRATRTPHFALINSIGCDGPLNTSNTGCANTSNSVSAGRTISTTYVFKTNDLDISGGEIMLYPAGSDHYCMDAGSSPDTGTEVMLQKCSTTTPPSPAQVWEYRQDLSIELVSSATTTNPLCLDTGASPTAHHKDDPIVLEPCEVSDTTTRCPSGVSPQQYAASHPGQTCVASPMCPAGVTPQQYKNDPVNQGNTCSVSPWNQQWSVDDNGHLQGAKKDQSNLDGYCIDAATQAPVALTLQKCAGSTTDTRQVWVPSATTGAGMAGAGNEQLVNYQRFATCLDVTGQNPTASFLILYSCKQNPDATQVKWNQKFVPTPALGTAPTRTLLKVQTDATASTPNTTYCLRSPDTIGGYPTLSRPCPASIATAPPGFVWTVSQEFADASGTVELPYANRYTIKDDTPAGGGGPLCLSPGSNDDLWVGQYYKAVVTRCDGGTEQKWNASPSLIAATLTDTHETGAPAGG